MIPLTVTCVDLIKPALLLCTFNVERKSPFNRNIKKHKLNRLCVLHPRYVLIAAGWKNPTISIRCTVNDDIYNELLLNYTMLLKLILWHV